MDTDKPKTSRKRKVETKCNKVSKKIKVESYDTDMGGVFTKKKREKTTHSNIYEHTPISTNTYGVGIGSSNSTSTYGVGRSTRNSGNYNPPTSSVPALRVTRAIPQVRAEYKNELQSDPQPRKPAQPSYYEEIALWDEVDVLAQTQRVPLSVAKNFVNLLKEGCTLPFIARYRKDKVGNFAPDVLQDLFVAHQNIVLLKKKVVTVRENLKANNKLTSDVDKSLLNARSLTEVELIYAPLKTSSVSLAEKARKLGLEPEAVKVLNGQFTDLRQRCTQDEELATPEKVEEHVTHIVADIIYKEPKVLEEVQRLKTDCNFTLQSTLSKKYKKKKDDGTDSHHKKNAKSDAETYNLYLDWKCPVKAVKPHQVLAVNRGEEEKVLTVKVVIPDWYYNNLERFCKTLWRNPTWVKKGLEDAFKRFIKPWLTRQVRSELTQMAQKEAVKTFTANLEKYLLTEPLKNKRIIGLDPGFRAGCKVGVIDKDGSKLEVCTLHPELRAFDKYDPDARKLKDLIKKHRVDVLGLGNGTACRETETWLKQHNVIDDLPLVIVPEQGASVYSINKEARMEHPNMDSNLISALSIARRVLDPMGELIKVDPKNLGVGMYQHDIPPKMLEVALTCTLEKVVSLVGVDLNTASQALLRRISGLNDSRAKKIIDHRTEYGPFTSREDILKVFGIGKVTYQQCAGFLRVVGGHEPLDATIIHPESYSVARKFAKKLSVDIKHLNRPDFPRTIELKTGNLNMATLSVELNTDLCTMELILNAFKQKNNESDIISYCKPVYSLVVTSPEQLTNGTTLTGVVRNVVPFGCFVDCGVGDNGLIHRSKLNGHSTPKLGDRVRVTVIPSNKPNKLQLRLDQILN